MRKWSEDEINPFSFQNLKSFPLEVLLLNEMNRFNWVIQNEIHKHNFSIELL